MSKKVKDHQVVAVELYDSKMHDHDIYINGDPVKQRYDQALFYRHNEKNPSHRHSEAYHASASSLLRLLRALIDWHKDA